VQNLGETGEVGGTIQRTTMFLKNRCVAIKKKKEKFETRTERTAKHPMFRIKEEDSRKTGV